jgi:hypothetical protein
LLSAVDTAFSITAILAPLVAKLSYSNPAFLNLIILVRPIAGCGWDGGRGGAITATSPGGKFEGAAKGSKINFISENN